MTGNDRIFIPERITGPIADTPEHINQRVIGLSGNLYDLGHGKPQPGHWSFDQLVYNKMPIANPAEQLKRAPKNSPLAQALEGRSSLDWTQYPTKTVYDLFKHGRVEHLRRDRNLN